MKMVREDLKEVIETLQTKYPQIFSNLNEKEGFILNVALDDFRTLLGRFDITSKKELSELMRMIGIKKIDK